ncbi:hypothetical protein [Actinomadura graeca]|nr:hypothetical protein [Actinomadura graeca]
MALAIVTFELATWLAGLRGELMLRFFGGLARNSNFSAAST